MVGGGHSHGPYLEEKKMTDSKLEGAGQKVSAKVDELQQAFTQLKAELGSQASAAADRVEDIINDLRTEVQAFKDARSSK